MTAGSRLTGGKAMARKKAAKKPAKKAAKKSASTYGTGKGRPKKK
jgi:hypothetical protein